MGKRQRLAKEDVLFGALIGIPNYYSARFLLKSLSYVPAIVAYPTYSVSAIVLVSIAGVLLFGEKMNVRRKIAIALVLVALFLLGTG
jgi:Membrane transporters of cations and cationic drugs